MRLDLIKCHGSGNDFPLIDARALALDDREWACIARALGDRRGPVGGDGLLLLTAGHGMAAFGMRMFNPDGSEAETCLNGLRCVARLGFQRLGIDHATVQLATSHAAVTAADPLAPGVTSIRETAGPATLEVDGWPLVWPDHELVERRIDALPGDFHYTAVAIPNPHLVAFVDEIDEIALVRAGSACEAAPDWLPNRANVSFVEVRGGDLFVRTFERGVGLTDSCGSAMAASTFAACLTGRLAFGQALTVFNTGGLVRAAASEDAMVTITGNATWEWAGAATVDMATGRAIELTTTHRFAEEAAAWARLVEDAG